MASDPIEALELELEQLRRSFEFYFLGVEKKIPNPQREAFERKLSRVRIPKNAVSRFRLLNLRQRLTTLQSYWNRTLRAIEEGTYRRDVARADRKFLEGRAAPPAQVEKAERLAEAKAAGSAVADEAAAFLAQLGVKPAPAVPQRGAPVGQSAPPMVQRGAPVGQSAPPIPQRGAPQIPQRGAPPMAQRGTPPMVQRGAPVGQSAPPIPQRGAPQIPQRGAPQIPQRGAPPIPQRGAPPIPQRGTPQIPQRGTPQIPQRGTPQIPQRGAPQIPQRGAPPVPQRSMPPLPQRPSAGRTPPED